MCARLVTPCIVMRLQAQFPPVGPRIARRPLEGPERGGGDRVPVPAQIWHPIWVPRWGLQWTMDPQYGTMGPRASDPVPDLVADLVPDLGPDHVPDEALRIGPYKGSDWARIGFLFKVFVLGPLKS